ncbi:hypothetical protein ACFT7S_28240 [Streptomyces sp. NPDC057136]|uniref:hypothetical protein n=1 Tax=Streptomyces sp. NPDC057136 TaxID=3346029 RepID=UPI00363F1E20
MPKDSTPGLAVTVAWLQANGIDPNDVPLDSAVTEGVDSEGRPVIRYTALLRRGGRPYSNPEGTGPVTEEREALLVTPRSAAPGPWTAEHRVTSCRQVETRPGPLDEATGERWQDAQHGRLGLAACNCGYSTGWIPWKQIPSAEWLGEHHGDGRWTIEPQVSRPGGREF